MAASRTPPSLSPWRPSPAPPPGRTTSSTASATTPPSTICWARRDAVGCFMTAPLRIVVVYPDLLGTYGDGGNGVVLARRAEWRGHEVALLQAVSDRPLPEADVYCLGGGEDGPQVRAARTLIDDGTLARRVAEGAVVLAVCAGFQIVGRAFPGAAGDPHEGGGLLEIETVKPSAPRAVGELLVEVAPALIGPLPPLTG